MAVSLRSHGVSDLCIGKPALISLPPSATIADALVALKAAGEPQIAVLSAASEKKAVSGKLGVVDVICYLCTDENIRSPATALGRPVSALLTNDSAGQVRRVERNCSILEALDVILEGAQILVVPIRSPGRKKLHHQGTVGGAATSSDLCWLTQEDFVRYFLNSIAVFSHVATLSIDQLGLISSADALTIRHDDPASVAIPLIRRALAEQAAVAVAGYDGKLFGEISPSALTYCDEAVAAAIATLSAGDLMAYIEHYGFPPHVLVRAIKSRLKENDLKGMLAVMEEQFSSSYSNSSWSSSSSDEEMGPERRQTRLRSRTYSLGRRSEEAVVCHRESSLVAVMVQALAHRVSYVWVVDDDDHLIGIVEFVDVLKVFREQLQQ